MKHKLRTDKFLTIFWCELSYTFSRQLVCIPMNKYKVFPIPITNSKGYRSKERKRFKQKTSRYQIFRIILSLILVISFIATELGSINFSLTEERIDFQYTDEFQTPSSSFQFEFTDDFSSTDNMDAVGTNGTGWGTGELFLSPKNLSLISSISLVKNYDVKEINQEGNMIYLASDSDGTVAVNVSNRYHPYQQTTFGELSNSSYDSASEGKYLYVADGSGDLEVYHRIGMQNYELVDSYTTSGDIVEVEKNGRFLYTSIDNNHLRILDCLDPVSIKMIDSFYLNLQPFNLRIRGNLLYFYDRYLESIRVWNVSDANNAYSICDFSIPDIKKFEFCGNFLIASTIDNTLHLIDISNPNQLRKLDHLSIDEDINDLDIKNDIIYVAGNESGIFYVTIDRRAENKLFAHNAGCKIESVFSKIHLETDYIYAYNNNTGNFYCLALSEKNNPERAFSHMDSYAVSDIETSGNIMYVTYEHGGGSSTGWSTYNVSDPENPIFLNTYSSIYNNYQDINIQNNLAYLCDYSDGVEIFNVSDPENPVLIGQYTDSQDYSYKSDIWGDLLVIADGPDGINIVNISNPRNPVLINKFDDGGWAYAVEIQAGIAYLADGFQGLEVINITDLNSIKKIASYGNSYNNTRDITFSGTVGFIADRFDGIEIVNFADPTSPIKIGQYTDFYNRSIAVDCVDSMLHVSDSADGLHIINISDPFNPHLSTTVFSSDGNNDTRNSCFTGDYIYIADGDYGIEIYRHKTPYANLYTRNAIFQSTVIDETPSNMASAKITIFGYFPAETSYEIYLSANNGNNWEKFGNNTQRSFTNHGSQLRFRILANTSNRLVTSTVSSLSVIFDADNSLPVILNQDLLVNDVIWSQKEDFSDVQLDLSSFAFDYEYPRSELTWEFNASSTLIIPQFDGNNPHLLTISSQNNAYGTEELNLFLIDEEDANISVTLELNVSPVNDAPTINRDNFQHQYHDNNRTLDINVSSCINDVDSQDLNVSIYIGKGSSWELLVQNSSETAYELDVSHILVGDYDIRLEVTDGQITTSSVISTSIKIESDMGNNPNNLVRDLLVVIAILAAAVIVLSIGFYVQFKKTVAYKRVVEGQGFSNKFSKAFWEFKTGIKYYGEKLVDFIKLKIEVVGKKLNPRSRVVDTLLDEKVDLEGEISEEIDAMDDMTPENKNTDSILDFDDEKLGDDDWF